MLFRSVRRQKDQDRVLRRGLVERVQDDPHPGAMPLHVRALQDPIAFGGVAVRPLFADILVAGFDLAMIVDLIQQPVAAPPVAAPGVGVGRSGFLHGGKGRGKQAFLSRRAAQLENAGSLIFPLYPREDKALFQNCLFTAGLGTDH